MKLDKELDKFRIPDDFVPDEPFFSSRKWTSRPAFDAILYLPEEKAILLAYRKKEPAKGLWWSWGGGQKKGLPLKFAVKKCIKDESGIETYSLEQIGNTDHFWEKSPIEGIKNTHDSVTCFLATGRGKVNSDKYHDTRLITPEEYLDEKKTFAPFVQAEMDEALERFYNTKVKNKVSIADYYINTEPHWL